MSSEACGACFQYVSLHIPSFRCGSNLRPPAAEALKQLASKMSAVVRYGRVAKLPVKHLKPLEASEVVAQMRPSGFCT